MDTLLMLREFVNEDGQSLNGVWQVPAKSYNNLVRSYEDLGCDVYDARSRALGQFILNDWATFKGFTDQNAELLAANMREEGYKARWIK